METIAAFFNALFWIFLAVLVAGLIKPWTVLWFIDHKNRKFVLIYYGTIVALLFIVKIILSQLV